MQEFFELRLRPDGLVWLIRRDAPYTCVMDLHKAYDDLLGVVDDWLLQRRITSGLLGRKRRTPMGWLYDVRPVRKSRNDLPLERALQSRQPDLLARSSAIAVLVNTIVGRAQMHRLRKAENQGEPEIFNDEAAAIDWLLQKMKVVFADGATV